MRKALRAWVAALVLMLLPVLALAQVSLSNWQGMAPAVSERYPDSPLPLPTDSAEAISSPLLTESSKVWFGGREWVVIGWNGGGVASAANEATLLLADASPNKPGDSAFHGASNHYAGSTLQSAVSTFASNLPARESRAILLRSLEGNSGLITYPNCSAPHIDTSSFSAAAGSATTHYIGDCVLLVNTTFDWNAYHALRTAVTVGSIAYTGTYHPEHVAGDATSLTDEPLWPLSVAEASLLDGSIRAYNNYWWLRSPGADSFSAADADPDGDVLGFGNGVFVSAAVRPAFKLNLASVIFTSSADANGKSAASVGAGLNPAAAIAAAGAVKLTILDAGLTLSSSDTAARTVRAGGTVSIAYTGASTGANNVVSAVIENSSGAVLFYGKLVSAAANADGTASFTVPALAEGDYTLKLFVEEANADTATDFASAPISITMKVDNTSPEVSSVSPSGTGIATSGNVVITFSEAMDTAIIGTVALNALPALAGGTWTSDTVFTIPYSGLAYGTAYTVAISGFSDAAGNVMTADNSNTFTTLAATYTATVSPNAHTFAAATYDYGAQTAQQFTITNTGNQPLANLSASLSGGDFEISTGLSSNTLATPSGTATISVRPTTGLDANAAAYTDTLVIRWNNDGGGLSVNLSFAVNQATPTVTWPTASPITYGEALSASALSGGVGVGAGTFVWTDNMIVPSVPGGNYSVTFTPTDTTNYSTVTGAAAVTVNMATPSGTPSVTAIRQAGQTLNDANLSGVFINLVNSDVVPGSLEWDSAPATPVTQGTAYGWTFTPDDPTNFSTVTGSLILWPMSGNTASIPVLGPVGLGLLVLMLAGISGIRGQRSGIRKT